jgi:uncharacterized protein YaaR (DUF327 family)
VPFFHSSFFPLFKLIPSRGYNLAVTKIDPAAGAKGSARAAAGRKTAAAAGSSATGGRGNGTPPERLKPLLAKVEESGEELLSDPGGLKLEGYRRAVRELLDATMNEGMRVNSQSGFALGQQVFATVARIDIALTELTDEVLRRQGERLKTASYVSQIKGLIVDLFR